MASIVLAIFKFLVIIRCDVLASQYYNRRAAEDRPEKCRATDALLLVTLSF